MDLREIDRVSAHSFRPPTWGGVPYVVIDNVKTWKALHLWCPDYLKAFAGNREVHIREVLGAPRNVSLHTTEGGQVSFGAFIDWVIETANQIEERVDIDTFVNSSDVVNSTNKIWRDCSYSLDVQLAHIEKGLMNDIEVPNWYQTQPQLIMMWCGVFGSSSGLHFDVLPNCNVQIVGRKEFILFPPSEAKRLYPFNIHHSHFDPTSPDFERFPLARHAIGWKCTLCPGESLYIPSGWYHQVTVMSAWALNINFWWPRPFLEGVLTPVLRRYLFQRGVRSVRAALARFVHGGGSAG